MKPCIANFKERSSFSKVSSICYSDREMKISKQGNKRDARLFYTKLKSFAKIESNQSQQEYLIGCTCAPNYMCYIYGLSE